MSTTPRPLFDMTQAQPPPAPDALTQMVSDPNFAKMAIGEQRKALSAHDPSFGQMGDGEITKFVSAHQSQPQQTPQTLAQLVRAKYPGAYDDMDDATLEKNVLAKYPQYSDLLRTNPNAAAAARVANPPKEGFLGSLYNDAKGIFQSALGPGYSMYKGYTGQGINKKGGIAAAIEQPIFEHAQEIVAPAQNLLNLKNRYQQRNAAGYGPVYQGAAAVQDVLHPAPFLSTDAEESAASRGDTGAVLGHATIPLAATTVPFGASKLIGKVAPAAANALESSAAKNYEDVLNPTRVDTKFQTQQMMPKLLQERPVAMTRQGLADKAAANADVAGQQIEQTVSNMQGSMKTQPVIDRLENLRQQYQVNGVSLRPEVDGAINTLQDQLRGISQPGEVPGGAQGPGEASISNQDVVRARRILDQAVAEVGGYQGKPLSDTSLANIRKETANSFREELASSNPDLAALNSKFHFWNTLNDVLEQTIQRKTGQVNALPKMETVIAGAGGLAKSGLSGAAGYGTAMNILGKAFRSTGWRTMSAATKSSIADALASRRFQDVQGLLSKAGLVGVASKNFQTNGDIFDDNTMQQYEQDHRRF